MCVCLWWKERCLTESWALNICTMSKAKWSFKLNVIKYSRVIQVQRLLVILMSTYTDTHTYHAHTHTHTHWLRMLETKFTGSLIITMPLLLFEEDITQQNPAVPLTEHPQRDSTVICCVNLEDWKWFRLHWSMQHQSELGFRGLIYSGSNHPRSIDNFLFWNQYFFQRMLLRVISSQQQIGNVILLVEIFLLSINILCSVIDYTGSNP